LFLLWYVNIQKKFKYSNMTKTRSLFSSNFLRDNSFIMNKQLISEIVDSIYDFSLKTIKYFNIQQHNILHHTKCFSTTLHYKIMLWNIQYSVLKNSFVICYVIHYDLIYKLFFFINTHLYKYHFRLSLYLL